MQTHTREDVVAGTSEVVQEWIKNRLMKLRELNQQTMNMNPFMVPIIWAVHSHTSFTELATLLLGGHYSGPHLLDQKPAILSYSFTGSFDCPARYTSAGVLYPSDWCNRASLEKAKSARRSRSGTDS